MKKRLLLLAVAGAVLISSPGAPRAETDTPLWKQRKNASQGTFGFGDSFVRSKRDKQKRKRLFDGNWWDDGGDDGVNIISGQDFSRRRKNVIVADDGGDTGDGDAGFGMGNLTYQPPKLVVLNGANFAEPRPAGAEAAAVYDALTTAEPPIRVTAAVREAILDHYRANGFQPLWQKDGAVSQRAAAVLKLLSNADAEGLDATSYLPSSLSGFTAPLPHNDPAALARFDLELSAAALKYARDASGGQFDPRRLSLYNDITPPTVQAGQAMKVIAFSPFAAEYLEGLNPTHPAYLAMKKALEELRTSGSNAPQQLIEDGAVVKKGKTDPRIPAIRDRLADLGYPEALDVQTENAELLDADLSVQLRIFQKAMGIKVSGAIGPQTIAALNADTSGRDEAKLLNNMERLRWLPRKLANRHVFVNQAAFEVKVMEGGQAVWTSRVIVGKPMTQTSVFNDEMETVVFNPSWGVPPSIIANEYLPKLRRDPGYLDRIGFKVVNERGKQVRSSSVDWWSYGSKVPFGIQQPPGAKNALGEIKFLFPNEHNIYMHDTPNRELFENDVRAFSHGCVRVQNPREFAQVILGWDPQTIDDKIDSKQSETVKLTAKVPVHLTYFTAWPDDNGEMVYYNDIYGRDATLEAARNMVVLAAR